MSEISDFLRSCAQILPNITNATSSRVIYDQDGLIGEVLPVYVDNSTNVDMSKYPCIWVLQTLYHTREKDQRQKPHRIVSLLTFEKASGTDQMAPVMVEFPSSRPSGTAAAHGIMTTTMILSNNADRKGSTGVTVHIQGLDGDIQIYGPVYRPESMKIIRKGECRTVHLEITAGGHGMYWEADEAGRCIRDGKLESSINPWDESVIMEVVDESRAQADYLYPKQIESTRYPLSLKRKV